MIKDSSSLLQNAKRLVKFASDFSNLNIARFSARFWI